MSTLDEYDEFAELGAVAEELGRSSADVLPVRRESYPLRTGGAVSTLIWGASEPDVILVHGGGQNAHTWDAVAVDLGRPALAIDLPGHGQSSWRSDQRYWPIENAGALAEVMDRAAPRPTPVVGMSLGGLSAIRLAATRPDLVSRLILVDITPRETTASSHMKPEQRGTTQLIAGPREFDTFEEMVSLAISSSPRRSDASVRRGVRHNATQLPSGRWRWRYDFQDPALTAHAPDFAELWEDIARLRQSVLLVRGGASSHVTDAQSDELRRRLPQALVAVIDNAGHSVQSDQPHLLSALIDDFLRI